MKNITTGLTTLLILLLLFSACHEGPSPAEKQQKEEPKSEIALLTEAIEHGSDDPADFCQRGKLLLQNAEFDAAYADAMRSLVLDSTYSNAYVLLADIYLLSNKITNCEEALLKALTYEPNNEEALLKAAKFYLIIENHDLCKAYAKKVLDLNQKAAEAYYLIAYAYIETGDTLKGIRNLERTIEQDQRHLESYLQLARLYGEKGDPIALQYYKTAQNISPNNLDIMYLTGIFYQEKLHDYPKAMQQYDQILTLDTLFYPAWQNKGYINLVYLHDYNRAAKMFSQAIRINPEFEDAWYNLGCTYEEMEEYGKAKGAFERAQMINPRNELIRAGLERLGVRTPILE